MNIWEILVAILFAAAVFAITFTIVAGGDYTAQDIFMPEATKAKAQREISEALQNQ